MSQIILKFINVFNKCLSSTSNKKIIAFLFFHLVVGNAMLIRKIIILILLGLLLSFLSISCSNPQKKPLPNDDTDTVLSGSLLNTSEYLKHLEKLRNSNTQFATQSDWEQIGNVLRKISSLTAAVYDTTTDRLILIGEKGESDGPFTIEDLIVALRNEMFYREPPGMTIDPMPGNPLGPKMIVRYFGGTENTHFGKVMFECDRLLKAYSMGEDNITHKKITSTIPDYYNLLQIRQYRNIQPNNVWNRFWFVRTQEDYDSSDSRGKPVLQITDDWNSVFFRVHNIYVNTEEVTWSKQGNLVSSNGKTDKVALQFSYHFTNHYDEFAEENKSFYVLKELAKLVSLAKWIHLRNYYLDLDFLRNAGLYNFITTDSITPSNKVTESWKQTKGSKVIYQTSEVFGGVNLGGENFYAEDTEGKAGVYQQVVLSSSKSHLISNYWDDKDGSEELRFVAIPTSFTNYRRKRTNKSLVNSKLKLITYRDPQEEKKQWIEGVPGSEIIELDRIFLKSDDGDIYIEFGEPIIDQVKRKLYYPSYDRNIKGYYPQDHCVEFADNTKLYFNENNDPVYYLGPDQKINELAGLSSRANKYNLQHDKEDRTQIHIKSDRDLHNYLSLLFLQLSAQADASLIKTPQNIYLLHDQGFNEDEMNSYIKKIPTTSDGKKHVKIIITHPDLDHYKGLRKLLDQREVVIDEIMVGTNKEKILSIQKNSSDKSHFASLIQTVFSKGYELLENTDLDFVRFIGKSDKPVIINKMSLDKCLSLKNILDTYEYKENLESYDVLVEDGLKINIIKLSDDYDNTKDRHKHNLIFHYEHNGFSFIDMGDANEKHLKAISEQIIKQNNIRELVIKNTDGEETIKTLLDMDKNSPVQLPVNVLKWPHHEWFPQNEQSKKVLIKFLKLIQPQMILINVPKGKNSENNGPSSKRREKIKKFIKELIDPDIEIMTTDEFSHEFQALILLKRIKEILEG